MSRNNRPPRQSFGLSLERLEARDVPAAYWWHPQYGDDSNVATNWLTAPDPLAPRHSEPPNYDDDLYVLGGFSFGDCELLAPTGSSPAGAPTFNGVHLIHGLSGGDSVPTPMGYWDTVTTKGNYTLGALTVECGYIRQDDPVGMNPQVPLLQFAGTLTITASLSWTGGTLNSNSVPGFINLAPGATGVAEPSFTNPWINGTVTLGSTLRLMGNDVSEMGSTMSLVGGVYNVFRSDIIAEAYSSLFLIAADDGETQPKTLKAKIIIDGGQHTTGNVEVKPKSKAVISTSRDNDDNPLEPGYVTIDTKKGEFKNSGTTEIVSSSQLQLGNVNDDVGGGYYVQDSAGQTASMPLTTIETGSTIACQGNKGELTIKAGRFEVTNRLISGQPTDDRTVRVVATKGFHLWEGATINMGGVRFNTLQIDGGDFYFFGEVRLAIASSADQGDKIMVAGDVYVNKDTAKLAFRWGDPLDFMKARWREWLLIQSSNGTIDSDLDPSRIDVSALGRPFKPEDVKRTEDKDALYLVKYITPLV